MMPTGIGPDSALSADRISVPCHSSHSRCAVPRQTELIGNKETQLSVRRVGTDDARVAAINALLAAGAEVDAQNGDGYTALHLASLAIKPKLVAALVQGGARVDLATSSHKSATV